MHTGREYGRESAYLNRLTRMDIILKRRLGRRTVFNVKPKPVVLKLGGSLITIKDQSSTANLETIQRISVEIANALKSEKGPKGLVVVIGLGSFGHHIVMRYDLVNASLIEAKERVRAFSMLKISTIKLLSLVAEELLRNGVPALPIDPQYGVLQLNGELDISLLSLLLKTGFVPVICGTAMIDDQRSVQILGGDHIACSLAKKLNASKVIFGTDVDGIFTSNPKINSDAKLVGVLNLENLDQVIISASASGLLIGGGMLGKLRQALEITRQGIEVVLLNGLKPHLIEQALCDEKVLGTYVKAMHE